MDFKVVISCEKCQCSFELRPEDFKDRLSMECPNCCQAFPVEIYKQLRTGIVALGNVPEYISDDGNDLGEEQLFTVRVKSFGIMNNMFGKTDD